MFAIKGGRHGGFRQNRSVWATAIGRPAMDEMRRAHRYTAGNPCTEYDRQRRGRASGLKCASLGAGPQPGVAILRRRDFITLIGGVAAVWPLAARAQAAMVTVGVLQGGPVGSLAEYSAQMRKGLSEMGYVEGRNLALEYRYAQNQLERLPELAADLIRHQAAVIVTLGSDAVAAAAKAATTTTPIVFEIGGDPVEGEFVASLGRPGGNLTGVTSMNAELSAKRLGLLHDLLPQARHVATILRAFPE